MSFTAQEGYDGRFAIFAPPNIETATKQELVGEYRPSTQVSTNGVIDFNVPNSSLYYIDLSRTRLCIKLQILRNKVPIVEAHKVALANNVIHSLWQKIDLQLNQTPVGSEIAAHYAYKAIFDKLLFCSKVELETSKQSEGFFKDTAGNMESTNMAQSNVGLFHRYNLTAKGKIAQFEGYLNLDVMGIQKFIPNGIGMQVKLFPNQNAFCLMSGEEDADYVVDVTELALKVQYIEPTNNLIIGHAEAFNNSLAIFPYMKSVLKNFTIPLGVQTWSIDTLYVNEIPDTLIVGMVDSKAYTGDYALNPFNFQHFNLTNLTFYIEGHPLNTCSFSPDFANKHYTNEYLALFDKGVGGQGIGADIIPYEDFAKGYAIFKINIAEGLKKNFTSLSQRGQTRLKFRFSDPLEQAVTVICYGQVSSIIQIDKAKNVIAH